MPVSLASDTLYKSEILSLTDVRCRPHDSCIGGEEASATHDIVFPRRGCFVRHVGRSRIVADAGTVLLFRKGEAYHVSHPVSGGDDCTCLTFAPEILADAFGTFDPTTLDGPDDPFRATRMLVGTGALVALHRLRRAAGDHR